MRPTGSCSSTVARWSRPRRRKSSSPARGPSAPANSSCATPAPARRPPSANPSKEPPPMPDAIFHLIPGAPKPVAPYSHVVEQEGWLFVTGQLATDPDDDSLPPPEGIEAQTHKVFDNLRRALEGAGASFADVLCVRIFLTEFERDYAALNEIYATYFD